MPTDETTPVRSSPPRLPLPKGRRGTVASAKRAIAWWKSIKDADGIIELDRIHGSYFLCRGCGRWTHFDDGAHSGHGEPGDYCCNACDNRIYEINEAMKRRARR